MLAGVVGRMRLAREDDLQRSPGVLQHAKQAIGIAEEEGGALVRREAAGEADRQRFRIEQRAGGEQLRRLRQAAHPAQSRALADLTDESALQLQVNAPQLVVADRRE